VEWDSQAAVTPLGQLPFFIDFLRTADLYERWVEDCPLAYRSNNAPEKRDVLGTLFLSILSGQLQLMGWTRSRRVIVLRREVKGGLVHVDKKESRSMPRQVRRAFIPVDEEACAKWLGFHLDRCYGPLLYEPWIMDMDATVKPLYGHQEGAVVGYNPG